MGVVGFPRSEVAARPTLLFLYLGWYRELEQDHPPRRQILLEEHLEHRQR
jgi:hypothetical protein